MQKKFVRSRKWSMILALGLSQFGYGALPNEQLIQIAKDPNGG
ncbi:MAG: hypothetical protein ABI767_05550 [Rhodanobacter sp.]